MGIYCSYGPGTSRLCEWPIDPKRRSCDHCAKPFNERVDRNGAHERNLGQNSVKRAGF